MYLFDLELINIRFPYYRSITLPAFIITPFQWFVLPEITKSVIGDYNDWKIRFLCLVIYQRLLNKKGRENKAYRKSILNLKSTLSK